MGVGFGGRPNGRPPMHWRGGGGMELHIVGSKLQYFLLG